MLQTIAYAICTLCAIGAVSGFAAAGWQIGRTACQYRVKLHLIRK